MARKDVQIKELFGNLAETESSLRATTKQETADSATPTSSSGSSRKANQEKRQSKSYRERVDAIHGKPTTVRLKPETIQRVNLATKKFRVKKGEFYNFAINYFLDQLEEDPTILPVTPAKYDIDHS